MKNYREKAPVFLMGLIFGLIIAGGFFIFKLDDYFKELSVYKSLAGTFLSSADQKPAIKERPATVLRPKKQKKEKRQDLSEVTSSLQTEPETVIPDSAEKMAMTDTVLLKEDDIVVRKDELLSTLTLEVHSLDPVASRNTKDSVLQKMSGIKDDRSAGKQMLNIEFWTSPLNYKGYKMGKYKIVLYGITSWEGMKLYKLDDIIYLRNAGHTYRLDTTSEFKPYDRVTDEGILSRLK